MEELRKNTHVLCYDKIVIKKYFLYVLTINEKNNSLSRMGKVILMNFLLLND